MNLRTGIVAAKHAVVAETRMDDGSLRYYYYYSYIYK